MTGGGEDEPFPAHAHTRVTYAFLLQLENGEPADPTVFVSDDASWRPDDTFAARDGSRWRIVAVDTVPPQLAAEGFVASWIVSPLD